MVAGVINWYYYSFYLLYIFDGFTFEGLEGLRDATRLDGGGVAGGRRGRRSKSAATCGDCRVLFCGYLRRNCYEWDMIM